MAATIGFSSSLDGRKANAISGNREVSNDSLTGTRKRWVETYLVLAANASEDTDDILAASGLPVLLSLKESAYVVDKQVRESDIGALLYEVDVFYDSHIDSTRPRALEWSWSGETIEEVQQRDPVTGLPYVNSVGEPLIVTVPTEVAVLTATRIEQTFDPNTIYLYKNRTNASFYLGAAPFTALMADIRDESIEISGQMQRKVTYVIKFNFKFDSEFGLIGWQVALLNHGTKFLNDAGNLEVFRDHHGTPITGNLNFDGKKRSATLSPLYILRHRHRTTDFSPLNLGPFS